MSEKLIVTLIQSLPGILWALLAFAIFAFFYKPVRYELLPKIGALRLMGFELSFRQMRAVSRAISLAEKSEKWGVDISETDKERVLARIKRHGDVLRDARVLWIDDAPENCRNERKMFHEMQVMVDLALSGHDAFRRLEWSEYDLIISDIARDDDNTAGLKFLQEYQKKYQTVLPVIFYIGVYQPEKGIPPYAFGVTNRPDELVHLTLDALERKRYG